LVRLKPDVLLTHGSGCAGKRRTIPIVVGPANRPWNRNRRKPRLPWQNITGLTLVDNELEPKRLQILKEAVQNVSVCSPGESCKPAGILSQSFAPQLQS
jgi:hypothetical protein